MPIMPINLMIAVAQDFDWLEAIVFILCILVFGLVHRAVKQDYFSKPQQSQAQVKAQVKAQAEAQCNGREEIPVSYPDQISLEVIRRLQDEERESGVPDIPVDADDDLVDETESKPDHQSLGWQDRGDEGDKDEDYGEWEPIIIEVLMRRIPLGNTSNVQLKLKNPPSSKPVYLLHTDSGMPMRGHEVKGSFVFYEDLL